MIIRDITSDIWSLKQSEQNKQPLNEFFIDKSIRIHSLNEKAKHVLVPSTVKCVIKRFNTMEQKLEKNEQRFQNLLKCETKQVKLYILHHMTRPGSVLEGFRHTLNRHALESGLFPLS